MCGVLPAQRSKPTRSQAQASMCVRACETTGEQRLGEARLPPAEAQQ